MSVEFMLVSFEILIFILLYYVQKNRSLLIQYHEHVTQLSDQTYARFLLCQINGKKLDAHHHIYCRVDNLQYCFHFHYIRDMKEGAAGNISKEA